MLFGTKISAKVSYELLDLFFSRGGTFIDTANMYAYWVPGFKGGESESLLGQWIKSKKNRDKLFIATKVGFSAPVDNLNTGLRASQIEKACNSSLKRLGIDAIDLYYAHVDDRNTSMEESLKNK
ncbi:MAG: aldo/keto reductase [Actinobacteria bacterium]|nr:aldo/keto reductase [Actinomycetota bacterium]